ncbi:MULTISPECIES: hypothetical protein [unclassified Haloferax]|uniref:hypothetical protein n=1 Tax=unclassified Haloferax TaxID=2625095 RepID=UPI001266FAE7|nr:MULTISPECIES: hypothetical protein [unclassified Haloferax]
MSLKSIHIVEILNRLPIGGSTQTTDEIKVELTNKLDSEDLKRIENIQLATATLILSGYIATLNKNIQLITEYETYIRLFVLLSSLFLLLKIISTTLSPFIDRDIIEILDKIILPFTFMFVISGGALIIILSWLPQIILNFISPITIIMPKVVSGLQSTMFNIGLLLLSAIASVCYAYKAATKMSALNSKVPDVEFTLTSGGSGDQIPIRITNNTSSPISKSDIKLRAIAGAELELDIEGAKRLEENIWEPRLGLMPGKSSNLNLSISKSDSDRSITEREAIVEILFHGDVEQTHHIRLKG